MAFRNEKKQANELPKETQDPLNFGRASVDNGDQETTNHQLLQAQAHMWNHIFSFINSMSLKCAIELGIPDIIHNHAQPMTLPDLITALSIPPSKAPHLHRLMRLLSHSGFFALQKFGLQEGYVLTQTSHLLLRNNPYSVSPFLLFLLDPAFNTTFHSMSNWFQNDDPTTFETAHGVNFWEYAGNGKNLEKLFHEAMACDTKLFVRVMIDRSKGVFEGMKSLVDVGGGTGTVAKAIASAFPDLECTVLDLPCVVDGLEGSHNVKYLGGDMFEAIPPADAILLKWILHDWSDEECVKILKRCKEAILRREGGGKVIVIEMVMYEEMQERDRKFMETQLFFDMQMMVVSTGKERNEKEWAKLFSDAGFGDYKISPILGLRSLIEIYP